MKTNAETKQSGAYERLADLLGRGGACVIGYPRYIPEVESEPRLNCDDIETGFTPS